MITAVNGVLLAPEEAEFIVGALEQIGQMLDSRPSTKLGHTIEQLRRMSRKCRAHNGETQQSATNEGSSRADETEPAQDDRCEHVSTAEAARILGVKPAAVSAMARRTPETLGSTHHGGVWRHRLDRVEQRAIHKHRRYAVYISTPGVNDAHPRAHTDR